MANDPFISRKPIELTSSDQIYFLHIGKTGGRSFEDFLKSQFLPEESIRINTDQGYPDFSTKKVIGNYRLYLGHLGYHFLSYFPDERKPLWLTMLRDPVDRVISHYYFFRNTQPVKPGHIAYKFQELACSLSLLEFVESPETDQLILNYQFNNLIDSELLLYASKISSPERDRHTSAELVEIAKKRLLNDCFFFGITEQYQRSLELLCYTFNWAYTESSRAKLNVTPDKPLRADIPESTIEAIRQKTQLDSEVYEFAVELFESRYDAVAAKLMRAEKAGIPAQPSISLQAPQKSSSKLWLRQSFQRLKFFLQNKLGLIKAPPEFDREYYLSQWPDVAGSKIDPYMHYKVWGWKEGRNPSPEFDVAWYLHNNPDVLDAGVEPFEHYLTYGKYENRTPLPPGPSRKAVEPVSPVDPEANKEPKICFHIPAAPTAPFYSQIAMFRLALDSLGGVYKQADIIVSLGDDEIKPVPARWGPFLGNHVILNWAQPEVFRAQNYFAQVDARFEYDSSKYDVVVFADADTIMLKPIDDLLAQITEAPGIYGTIAHYPFEESAQELWRELGDEFLDREISFDYQYSLLRKGDRQNISCPFYINFGFVLMTPEIVEKMKNSYLQYRKAVTQKIPFYAAQVALTLAVIANDVPRKEIGLRYNFPNAVNADRLHPDELDDVRVIHYLRTQYFDRQKVFTAENEFDQFLSLELKGSNKIFQEYIRKITNGKYPFA